MSNTSWSPNPTAVILRASQLKALPFTRWRLMDKLGATSFLKEIGYKKPFLVPTDGTVAMLFEKCPRYFILYAKKVFLTDMDVCRPDIPMAVFARSTWFGDGVNVAAAFEDRDTFEHVFSPVPIAMGDQRTLESSFAPSRKVFFQLIVPNIREYFGDLLQ